MSPALRPATPAQCIGSVIWTLVGDFLRHDLPDTTIGEDVSCPNFFRLGAKRMLLNAQISRLREPDTQSESRTTAPT